MLELSSARYRCTGCGDCCRGWDIPLVEGEADAFRRLAANVVPAERLLRGIGRARHNGVTVETLTGSRGACVALAEDQRCLVHAAHGFDVKPRACRIFPFTFVAAGDRVRVGVSWACPAVVDSEGAPLDEQRGEIEALFAAAVDGTRYLLRLPDPVPLGDGLRIAVADALALVQVALTALDGDDPEHGWGSERSERGTHPRAGTLLPRLCRAGAVVALTQARLEAGLAFAAALDEARAGASALADEVLAAPVEVDRLSRALFRTLLKSTEPGRDGAAGRVGGALASLFGSGEVRLAIRPGEPARAVAWKAVERTRPGLDGEAQSLLSRWIVESLSSLTFFGDGAFGLSLAGGLDLKVLGAAVAIFLARAHAAADGRSAASAADLKRGLRQLEAGLTHRSSMPAGFERALAATASLDLLREQLGC